MGNGCSVLRQNGSVELVSWPAPSEQGSYEAWTLRNRVYTVSFPGALYGSWD